MSARAPDAHQLAKRVTLHEVAAAAGVSVTTASRAINGARNRTVPSAVAQHVRSIADRLGYVPNAAAQAMVSGRTKTLGLLLPDFSDGPEVAVLHAAMSHAVERDGLSVLVVAADGSTKRLVEQARALHTLRVRGIVAAFTRPEVTVDVSALSGALTAFTSSGGSVCTVGRQIPPFGSVVADVHGGGRALATLLLGAGYDEAWILTGDDPTSNTAARTTALRNAFTAQGPEGLAIHVLSCAETVSDARERLGAAVEAAGRLPRLVVGMSDTLVAGAEMALRDRGLAVPGDVAVAGWVAETSSQFANLTRVSDPLAEIARMAASIASLPASANVIPRHAAIPVVAVLGSSTPPVIRTPQRF